MKRRAFITMLGGAAAWPLAAHAQQKMRRIGVLMSVAEGDPDYRVRIEAFRRQLHELGWVEGRSVTIDFRWAAGDIGRMPKLAAELIGLSPDVLVAVNAGTLNMLHRATRTVPIVFANVSDPVGLGIVKSLARPGGNVTGFSNREYTVGGKWLELLREMAPQLTRIGVMHNPLNPASIELARAIEKASSPDVRLSILPVKTRADIDSAVQGFVSGGGGGLISVPDGLFSANRDLVRDLTINHRLPTIHGNRFAVVTGGLMSYGQDTVDTQRRAALYVDRILRGEKPADLPVQQPTKFEFVINLKTAKAIGLTVPPTLLARADEVIE